MLELPVEPPAPDPRGVEGAYAPEAELAFAKARVLWDARGVCSDPGQAVAYLDEALQAAPDYPEALLRRGMALSDLGFHDDAFDDISRAIRLAPTAEAYTARGRVLLRLRRVKASWGDLTRALAMDEDCGAAWNLRGAIAYELEKIPEACRNFEQGCKSGDCTGLEAAREEGICH